MITKTVYERSLDTGYLQLGRVGETRHVTYNIRCDSVFDDHPTATVTMLVRKPDGTIYDKTVSVDAPSVLWLVESEDTTIAGNGQAQLTFTDGQEVIKTVIANTEILPSIIAGV